MNFNEAIVSGYKNYFNIRGRATRSEYWNFVLFSVLIMILISVGAIVIAATVFQQASLESVGFTVLVVVFIYVFAFALPLTAMQVRRIHDIGQSGWWVFLVFVLGVAANFAGFANFDQIAAANEFSPINAVANLASFALLIASILPSQPRANKYGEVPAKIFDKDGDTPPAPANYQPLD